MADAQSDASRRRSKPTGRQIFEATLSGAQDRPWIPRLRGDPPAYVPLPHTLAEFRKQEGRAYRKKRLRALWERLPTDPVVKEGKGEEDKPGPSGLTRERAQRLENIYEQELYGTCGGKPGRPEWKEFVKYAESKEVELWSIFHDELDMDGNGHLDGQELEVALSKAGIELNAKTLDEFMHFLTASPHAHAISFSEFRDFLLLLPRKISAEEIYRYYQVKTFMGDDGRGAARVTMEGDVTLSAEDKPPLTNVPIPSSLSGPGRQLPLDHTELEDGTASNHRPEQTGSQTVHWLDMHTAVRFLAAGGIAGAVSRTCTAPFDRLKIFLITRPPELGGAPPGGGGGIRVILGAVTRIFNEGGIRAFWIGNGLSVAKIFPESAIKFMSYETSKKAFAKYWDEVDDVREISGTSRFLAGGIGGINSQLSIYPMETLKTQMMSSTGAQKRTLIQAAKHVWRLGGLRAYYRGLTIGLIGVFPYSAIDMSTFEALKLAYAKARAKAGVPDADHPPVYATLIFGSISGSVGATSVYPLNLVRTRLQAAGSSGHPHIYTGGFKEVIAETWRRDGLRGFYRGLFPTLAKVVPAVSISYVVYEHSKQQLGV